jgi:hypothetical protein
MKSNGPDNGMTNARCRSHEGIRCSLMRLSFYLVPESDLARSCSPKIMP